MVFVNLSLLLGTALIAVPIIVHLVLRQQPKQLVFPALRFLQERRESNRRSLQLRHWLLLALRCAAIAILALALARPSVDSAAVGNWLLLAALAALVLVVGAVLTVAILRQRGRALVVSLAALECFLVVPLLLLTAGALRPSGGIRLGEREAPVSAVLVFDSSPRMHYQYQNQSRLKAAQDIGLWLLQQFPADSEIGVLDAHPGPAAFSVDLAAAKKAVERLQTTAVAQPMPEVLKSAWSLAAAGRHARKEIYVLTDLTAASWSSDSATASPSTGTRPRDTALYVIDVGVTQPRNVSLGDLRLSSQSLAKNNELRIDTDLRATGSGGSCAVELLVEDPDPERPLIVDGRTLLPAARLRDRREVSLADNASQTLSFRLSGLAPGVHQGTVSLSSGDGLTVDDTRFFAIEVLEAWPVLIVAPRSVNASFFTEAIAPYQYRQTQRARFECTVIAQTELVNRALDSFTVVALLDPEPLTPTAWEQLAAYVERGGALVLFLGHLAEPTSFQAEAARRLLGGRLKSVWRSAGRDLLLAPRSYEHPILAPFRQQATSVPWDQAPVFRHWVFEELDQDTHVVLPFSNGKPALLERSVQKGRVLVLTTPISDPARPAGREAWNELPTSEDAWPFFVLANELMVYLAGAGNSQLNYSAGETAVLANDPDKDPQRYQLFTPAEEPQEITAGDDQVVVTFTERPGAYRLRGNRNGPVTRGFAVNLPARVTDLSRAKHETLAACLGQQGFQLARSREEIKREVGEARVGREFYPYLLVLLAVVLALEFLLANRFYRRQDTEQA
jgi:hypothetical protein